MGRGYHKDEHDRMINRRHREEKAEERQSRDPKEANDLLYGRRLRGGGPTEGRGGGRLDDLLDRNTLDRFNEAEMNDAE